MEEGGGGVRRCAQKRGCEAIAVEIIAAFKVLKCEFLGAVCA